MPETTINIVVDKASKQKLQLTIKSSEANHSEINKWHVEFKMAVSKNENRDNKKVKKIANVDRKHAPFVPMKRPNPAHDMKLKNGKTKIQKYINNEL